ncbi:DNA polymerase III subunit alpha [Candidatus Parcubacteria bacterium]|nr:MAG: DNA polymerase III subunit alpha [Candidatus Parcubacteria bacterium]
MTYIHLHTHSHYSLLDGLAKINELVAKAKEYKMPALALTDHGNMYGAVEFYQKAKKAGIKSIIGMEAYVARNGHQNKRPKIDDSPYHLILLAKNKIGYQNLMKLTTIAHLDGFYYKPRIDHDLLEKYHEGLIGLTACLQGEVARTILTGDMEAAERVILKYQKIFGAGNFFLEAQYLKNIPKQMAVNESLFKLGKKLGVAVVCTNDVHYLNPEDNFAQDVLVCIQTKKQVTDDDRLSMMTEDFSFRSPGQVKEQWRDYPEIIKNTEIVANLCDLNLEFGKILLPKFDLPKDHDPNEYLKDLCDKGMEERFGKKPDEKIKQRLSYELDVIRKTGYASYFLIVQDFINWAKNNGIVVGPGRGSAAGSLVSYLVNITDIDPIKYELLFERFLNPERISMPDIDTDFADTRRDEVIRYVEVKYGKGHVAQIITFGTMAARAAIRDVGRVLGLPYSYCDKVAKMIPMFTGLQEAIDTVPELQEVTREAEGKKLIDTAKKLEGCARHASTHACGIVITPEPLVNFCPEQYSTKGDNEIISQYEMHAIEDLGLLKMDFLGLKNLTIIENTLEILKKALDLQLAIDKIPLDDKKTFQLLKKGETTGVFQLESSGMKRYLKMLKPTEFEDIIAMVALYRPGPMEFIDDYIKGKNGKIIPYYHDKRLEPILSKTYGIAVYQEQIMEIARSLAGFSYSEADVLRKAVGKKIKELLDEQEEKMIAGMINNGIKPQIAKQIWDFVIPFARYGFNRSHAACYALIAYRTAYLKAHYPAEFMASLLTADQGNMDRIAIEVEECRQMGLQVLPPDINESFSTFTVVYENRKATWRLRFGLSAIKNLGENIVSEIIKERKFSGPFKNLEDLLSRVKTKDLNKKSLEALIKSGALDSFGERNQMVFNIEKLLLFIKNINAEIESKQANLFGLMAASQSLPKLVLESIEAATDKQKLAWEKEFLGLYVSSHPMREYAPYLQDKVVPLAAILSDRNSQKKILKVAGIISTVKKITTKNGEPMIFARIEDATSGIEVLVFPSILKAGPDIWAEDKIVMISCKISDKDGEPKLICNHAREINKERISEVFKEIEALEKTSGERYFRSNGFAGEKVQIISGTAYVKVPAVISRLLAEQLKAEFRKTPGHYKVILLTRDGGQTKKIATYYTINNSKDAVSGIENILGKNTVMFENIDNS